MTRRSGLLLAALTIFAWFICMQPILFAVFLAAYVALLFNEARSVKEVGKLEWMLAVMMLHAVSVAGIFAGWVVPPAKYEYLRLLRRPD